MLREEIRKLLGREPKSYDIHCDIEVKDKSGVKAVKVRVDDKTIDYAVGFPKELSKDASLGVSLPTISAEGSQADRVSYDWRHYINKDLFEPVSALNEIKKEALNDIVQNASGTVSAHPVYSVSSEIDIEKITEIISAPADAVELKKKIQRGMK